MSNKKDGHIVVTAFQSDNKYLSDYPLLWRTAFSPSQQSLLENGGSSRLSALKEVSNINIIQPQQPVKEVKESGNKLKSLLGRGDLVDPSGKPLAPADFLGTPSAQKAVSRGFQDVLTV